MSNTIQIIQNVLQDAIDATPKKVSIFFKTGSGDYAQHDQFMGITVPTLRKIAKKILSTTLEDLVLLIHSPINEKRLFALIILTQQYKVSADHQKEELYQFYTAHIRHI